MAVPKKKTSCSRRNMRRAHDALNKRMHVSICGNCGADHLPHNMCPSCGWYRGRHIMTVSRPEVDEADTGT